VKPKASLFGYSVGSSQGTTPTLKPTKSAKKDLHFATVASEVSMTQEESVSVEPFDSSSKLEV
jgi:hypothetical protein